MTEQPKAPQRSAGPRSWPWMILALLAVGGFMWWLAATSQQTAVEVVEEDVETESESEVVVALTLEELVEAIDGYLNQSVRVSEIEVAARLGDQLFWTTLDDGQPYLVKVGDSIAAEGFEISPGEKYEAEGMVIERNDAVLDAWEATGVITDEGQRMEAEFAMWYLDAAELLPIEADS